MTIVRTIKLPSEEPFFWLLNKREVQHVANLLEAAEFKHMPITLRALVANFAVHFGNGQGRKPLKISLDWLDFIELLAATDVGDGIGKLTDEAGQQVRFIRPIPDPKAISADDVALLDKYFGPAESPAQIATSQHPSKMLPVPDYLSKLGLAPRNPGYAAIKLSIERIRMKKAI